MSYNYNAHNFKSQDILTGLERKANLIKKKKSLNMKILLNHHIPGLYK